MGKYTLLVMRKQYVKQLVEADSEEAIYVGDYDVISEWDAEVDEAKHLNDADEVLSIERNPA